MPWRNTPDTRARDAKVYGPEYRANRELARRRADGRCEGCHHKHARLQCDHVVNTASTGTPDHSAGNLQMLCAGPGSCRCHERKTAQEGGGWRNGSTRVMADPDCAPRTRW
jgi:hypothetical protein